MPFRRCLSAVIIKKRKYLLSAFAIHHSLMKTVNQILILGAGKVHNDCCNDRHMFQRKWCWHFECPLPCLQQALSSEVALEVSNSPYTEIKKETTHHVVWPEVSGGSLSLHPKISPLIPTEVWKSIMSPLSLWVLKRNGEVKIWG